MNKDIEKKSVLSGSLDSRENDDPEWKKAREIDFGKKEDVHVKNPVTGKTALVSLDRSGETAENVASILVSHDATKDQKDRAITAYLFDRGMESASFLAELFRSKGQHTRETRLFKTQMRFDYESFVSVFTLF